MKIGFSVIENKEKDSFLDSRFGRAGGFIIYDTENEGWNWLDNKQNTDSPSGAGIQAAQLMVNAEVNVFIGAHLGPKAFKVLNEAGIALFLGEPGVSLDDNLKKYNKGLLNELKKANSVGF